MVGTQERKTVNSQLNIEWGKKKGAKAGSAALLFRAKLIQICGVKHRSKDGAKQEDKVDRRCRWPRGH